MNKNKLYFATIKFRKSIESFFHGTFLSKKSDNKENGIEGIRPNTVSKLNTLHV